jgi:transposase
MMHISLHNPADLDELNRRIAAEPLALQRDRYRAVRLALDGMPTLEIAAKLDRSRDFVQTWVYAYRDGGIDSIKPKPQPGRPPKLPPAEQRHFIERFKQGPSEEDHVCTLRGKDAQRLLHEHYGVDYSLRGVFDLLHRHNLSCLKPRPRHRKNDPQAMQQWLDDTPFFSRA